MNRKNNICKNTAMRMYRVGIVLYLVGIFMPLAVNFPNLDATLLALLYLAPAVVIFLIGQNYYSKYGSIHHKTNVNVSQCI